MVAESGLPGGVRTSRGSGAGMLKCRFAACRREQAGLGARFERREGGAVALLGACLGRHAGGNVLQ